MSSIVILMATYNGEEFIRRQIESIQAQTEQNWRLVIRDDGSTDGTLAIIQSFCQKDQRISLLPNTSDFHGAYVNFHYLINQARQLPEAEIFFFCDQDDIWLPNKLEETLRHFQNDGQAELVYSEFSRIDDQDNILQSNYLQSNHLALSNSWQLFVNTNSFVLGCSMAFNRALLELVPEIDMTRNRTILAKLSHDKYLAYFALLFGRITFIPQALLHYRLHGSNVTSMFTRRKSLQDAYIFFKRGVKERLRINAVYISQTLFFLDQIKGSPLYTEQLADLQAALGTGGWSAVSLLWQQGVKRRNARETLLLYLIILTKAYQPYLLFGRKR